jgi:hypothetical protein
MLSFLYPFKKKIKISLVDTDNSKEFKELRKSYVQSLEELHAERRNYLLILIKNYFNSKIAELELTKKPFNIGDFVVIDYYGESYYDAIASTGIDLVKNFRDIPELKSPLKINSIFPYTTYLENKLGVSKKDNDYYFYSTTKYINKIIINSTSILTLEANFKNFMSVLESTHKNLIDWAIDFDWEYHNIKYEDRFLFIKWGGFSPSTFFKSDSNLAIKQQELFEREDNIKNIYEEYKTKINELSVDVESFKKELYEKN